MGNLSCILLTLYGNKACDMILIGNFLFRQTRNWCNLDTFSCKVSFTSPYEQVFCIQKLTVDRKRIIWSFEINMYWICTIYTWIGQLFQLYNLIKRIPSRKRYSQNGPAWILTYTVTREIQTFNVRPNHAFFNLIYNLFRPVHLSQTFITGDYG